jgi:hypothetical protein
MMFHKLTCESVTSCCVVMAVTWCSTGANANMLVLKYLLQTSVSDRTNWPRTRRPKGGQTVAAAAMGSSKLKAVFLPVSPTHKPSKHCQSCRSLKLWFLTAHQQTLLRI